MSSDGPSKRRRTDEEDSDGGSPQPPLWRDDEVWLSDGNIIIITSDDVAFRAHKSILAQRSKIFSDLFTLLSPIGADVVDGCRSVCVVPDSSDDLRPLLLVLCCGKKYA